MKIIVVSHPDRIEFVRLLTKHLPIDLVVTNNVSALSGHREALNHAALMEERVVIMEDDAIPVEGFVEKAHGWCQWFPNDLISFYLGTGRPPQHQQIIDNLIKTTPNSFIRYQMLHAVCYSMPAGWPRMVLKKMRNRPADYSIGQAWGMPVVYPIESLVEHRDTIPVEKHPDGQPRAERRVARRLAGKLMYEP